MVLSVPGVECLRQIRLVVFSWKTDSQILHSPSPLSYNVYIVYMYICSISRPFFHLGDGICCGRSGMVHSAWIVFFFSSPLPQCLSLVLSVELEQLIAFNASRRKGARNYLRFIANTGVCSRWA